MNLEDLRASAKMAVNLAMPSIQALIDGGKTATGDFYVHVALRFPEGDYDTLYEQRFGKGPWPEPFNQIAYGKTAISARTGLSSREVHLVHPELLVPHDVKYWGNAICGRCIVSCSGIQPWMDETISKIVLAIFMGMLQNEINAAIAEDDGYTLSF